MNWVPDIIQPGETLSSKLGEKWRDLYSHPRNETFRKLRPDPSKVHPGDRIMRPASCLQEYLRSGIGDYIELEKTFTMLSDPYHKPMKTVFVVLADDHYIDPIQTCLRIAHENSGWQGDYLLLAHEISDRNKLKWFKRQGIIVHPVVSLDIETNTNWPQVIWSKFYLFTGFFKQWDHVIFVDGDSIVNASMDQLLCLPGLSSTRSASLRSQFLKNRHLHELESRYDLSRTTYNTSTMSIGTEIITPTLFQELEEMARRYANVVDNPEQAIMGLVLPDYNLLPRSFCRQTTRFPETRPFQEGMVLTNKFWVQPKCPYYEYWWSKSRGDLPSPKARLWTTREMREIENDVKRYDKKHIHKDPPNFEKQQNLVLLRRAQDQLPGRPDAHAVTFFGENSDYRLRDEPLRNEAYNCILEKKVIEICMGLWHRFRPTTVWVPDCDELRRAAHKCFFKRCDVRHYALRD